MTHEVDNIFWAVVLGSVAMLVWTKAYFLFPKAVEKILRGFVVERMGAHLTRMALWVDMCGYSHLFMALRDSAMLVLMYVGYPEAVALLLWSTLLPLYGGGAYSLWAINALHKESDDINRFLHAAVDRLELGTS